MQVENLITLSTINLQGFKDVLSRANSFMLRDSSATPIFLTRNILKDALEATSSKSTMTGDSPVGPVQYLVKCTLEDDYLKHPKKYPTQHMTSLGYPHLVLYILIGDLTPQDILMIFK